MGRPLSLAVAGFFATGLAAGNVLAASWDMPTPYPDGNFHTKNIAQFAKELDGATGGQIKIKIHSAGSLFKHKEIKGAVRKGLAPIGEVLISLHTNESPIYGIDSVPFLATSHDESRKLYAAQRPFLEKKLAEEGLTLLYSVPWPPQGLYSKREINAIGDLKGLKFRTYNVGTARIAELAGAAPVQIEVPDLPTAFATGRVDVMITSASTGVQSKAEEYLTHYYDTQAWLPRNVVFMSKKTYDTLSADQRKAVMAAAKAAEERGWKASIEEMTIKTAALKKAGIKVQPPSPALRDGLRKIGKTLSDDWAKSAGADGKVMLDAYAK